MMDPPRLIPTTISACGQSLAGTAVWIGSDHLASFVYSAEASRRFAVAEVNGQPTLAVHVLWNRMHCHLCRRRLQNGLAEDTRLGMTGYCAECVAPYVAACLRKCRRLPVVGEFYCPACRHIKAREHLVPQEADTGRQRWICRPCRSQLVTAALNRRLRFGTTHRERSQPWEAHNRWYKRNGKEGV